MPDPAAVLADIDITVPGFFLRDDYFDLLAWLRANSPVHDLGGGFRLVSSYELIREVSRQPERYTSRRGALVNDPVRLVEPNDASGSILHLDPPLHAEYRKLLNREFTPRAAARFEPAIRKATADALARVPAGEVADFVELVASPIPVTVVADLLGVGDADLPDFRRWSDAIIQITDFPTDEVALATAELFGFLTEHVARRFASPTDDLLSVLASSEVGGERLTPDQVLMFCLTLLVAGNETTRALLSGGAEVLAQHPDQRAALAADPGLTVGAVEECVRWVTPIQAFCRTVNDDGLLGGTPVGAGDYLVLLYASGNRDEAAFGPTAGSFDITREATPAHVAFGFGEHLCLGAALARLEGRIVFDELLARFPAYELAEAPTYSPSTLTRSIATMPVLFANF